MALETLVFKGRAFDGEGLHQSAELQIDIRSGVITGFGERGALEEAKEAKVVQLEGSTVLPGLIDGHLHFYSSKGSGISAWATVPDTLAVLRAVGDMRRLLEAGFTAVRELGSKGGVHLAQGVEEGAFPGPDVISCSRALAQTGEDDDPPAFPLEIAQLLASYTYFCDGPWECRRAVRKVVRDGGKVVKFYASGAFSRGGRVRPNFTVEELNAIVEESHRAGLKVAAHAYGEEAIFNAIRAGVDSVEHGLGLTPSLAREMSKRGIFYVPTLVTYQSKSYSNRAKEQLVKRHLEEDLELAKRHKVGVVMGSDIVGDADRPHGRNFEEIAAEAKFLGNVGALVAATSRAAQCLGLQDCGMLKEGFRANAVVVKGDPTADIQALAPENVTHVVKSGELVLSRT
jgi:imidazolonepropionase-like amidohydrolase